jgi:hypothetical protein
MKNRKYRLLFSPKRRSKPGPKGPGKDLIEAPVQMKQSVPKYLSSDHDPLCAYDDETPTPC